LARVLSIAAVLGLLAATAVAFALTERAKLTLSPIRGTFVTKEFSPKAIDAVHRDATVRFKLRRRERIEVWIEDSHGHQVRTLLSARTERAGSLVDLIWNGFADDGVIVSDGVYRPVVKLETSHLTTVLPNPIHVDTVAPKIVVPHPLHPILSPDGDHHGDLFRVAYRTNESAHGVLEVRVGARTSVVEFTRSQKTAGDLQWNGKVQGKPLKPGLYVLLAAAQDAAGNRSQPTPFAVATIRYVSLSRKQITVAPGKNFALLVSTDAPSVQWQLHGRAGTEKSGTLRFRAPKVAGTYTLYISVGSHAARCTVTVK
jgi:hypothetical protein